MVDLLNGLVRSCWCRWDASWTRADHVLHPVGDVDSEIGGGTPGSPSDVVECRVVNHHTLHPLERPLHLNSLIFFIFFVCGYFILWFSLPKAKYTPVSIKFKKKRKKFMFAQIQALNLSNIFSKIMNLGKHFFYFLLLGHGMKAPGNIYIYIYIFFFLGWATV